ncbi:GH92 family glycosyl hydrolase [Sphingobacterium paludis]|uniref:Putative alpha-1,2-mannosidase n=1 Tax=Sphingobacterium paludis TaxID=1476465 RepID=A0A4R7CZG4_9SPHI|nr:GH92 family glycosyl hydrolase [Sphingobacterium paludis]TDS11936.1 putative alpha-1,2-mannosidase [Sphingobacterium paludis]
MINKRIKTILLCCCSLLLSTQLYGQAGRDLLHYVDPRIGTAHCRWFYFTPGASPFGMAKPAPSTDASYGNKSGWEAVGYDARHHSIEGFANFHEFQIGGVVFAPLVGALKTTPGILENPNAGYRMVFDKRDEVASPGYYSVYFREEGIRAELTSTKRVAFHRYTFPETEEAHILFDIGNQQGESGPVDDAEVYLTPEGRIEGYVATLPAYVQKYQPGAAVKMFFSVELSKKPTAFGAFRGARIAKGEKSSQGKGAGLYLQFSTTAQESVTLKAGLSYTSVANARNNLQAEANELSFDGARANAEAEWAAHLDRIRVHANNKTDMTKFYTGLYHALCGRGLASDVSGAYPKNDGTIGQIPLDANNKPMHQHYNTDAIWGAFWNLTQLWTLAYPEYYSDWVKSQLLVYKDAGWLGDGIANSRYVSGVGTNFVSLALASAYASGIRDFDVEQGYAAALKNEIKHEGRPFGAGKSDVDRFIQYGYVNHLDEGAGPDEGWRFSASHTLEYAFSSYAVSQWAKLLGKKNDERQLTRLAGAWKHIFDKESHFMRPKDAKGNFISDFKPEEAWRGFQEGNAWQYSFYVPHAPQQLVKAIGRDRFNHRLDSIFSVSQQSKFGGGTTLDAFSGLEGLYNHGNQPSLHIAWLFNYSGKPSLTQKWVRQITQEFYGADEIHGYGYGQDEDQGQLGAWYVLAAMGLFDVKGFTDPQTQLGIAAPLFDSIRIKGNPSYFNGQDFEIEVLDNEPENPYVQSFILNGERLKAPFLKLHDVQQGGRLVIQMGSAPKDKYK